jgi:hypothetical protein
MGANGDEREARRRGPRGAEGRVLTPDGWKPVSKRPTPGHPGDGTCNSVQYWACEHPENPSTYGVLFHSECPRCMVGLTAFAARAGKVFMCHGRSDDR